MSVSQPELYKDKIEVSLDGRQIFYLFFGGAVLVGMVFVLGVMVGRRVESRSHVDPLGQLGPRDRASSDPLAALDALEGKKLTFPSALVKPTPAADKPEVEHTIDKLEQARADKPADPKPDKKPADSVMNDKADKKKPDDKKADDKKADKADKAKSEPVTKPEQVKVEKPKTEPSVAPKGGPTEVVAKIDKPKPDKKKLDVAPINGDVVTAADDKKIDDAKVAAKKPDEKGKFTLQLSSFQDKHEAEAFLSSVKSAGYPAYLTETEISGKGTFYRVRLGTYRSLEAANDAKADVEKTLKKTASVMPR